MKVVTVIPILKGIRTDHLTYFTNKDVEVGSLVSVEVRKKTVKAVAIKVESAEATKEELKSSSFALKKIKSVGENKLFTKNFVSAVNALADYYVSVPGAVLNILTPSKIIESTASLKKPQKVILNNDHQTYVLQMADDERFGQYKSLIRESFARKKSVFFVVPKTEETDRAANKLMKGIEGQTVVLNNNLTAKELVKRWNTVITSKKPIVVVMTGLFVSLPRHDLGTIILDRETSRGYKQIKKPYIDLRWAIELYAKTAGIRFVVGDTLLSVQTLNRHSNNEVYEYSPLKFRILSTSEDTLVDMRKYKNIGEDKSRFEILSNNVKDIIEGFKENNDSLFIFVSRRGLAPTVVCADCNTTVTCKFCSSPIVLHGHDPTKKGNYFKCHTCGEERSAGELCNYCDSWNLKTLGIGIETVKKEIENEFPDIAVSTFDSDSAKTPKKAQKIADKFYENPGTVLIGTEMALYYLNKPVDNVACVSMDSLFSLPDFRIRERVVHLLLALRDLAAQKFVIQTRHVGESIFHYVISGNLADFYKEELRKREEFKYPPYSKFIKITRVGEKKLITKEMKELEDFFKPFEMHIFEAFTEKVKGKYVLNGLLRLEHDEWINESLLKKLKMLPLYFRIEVDAESLL